MKDWKSFFKGKNITLMGLGLLGRGVGDAAFLAECGANLIVTDLKDETALAPSLEKLKGYSNITYRLGGHDAADFRNRDFILKAAGVPLNSPFIAEANKNGIPIKMSASWFAEIAGISIVGVTGTRGKSTVTHMLYDVMKAAGLDVLLGGNVRGVATLPLLKKVGDKSIALMELDSWQCQGFGEAGISPHVSVFTTLYPDHMNYYPDMKTYLGDKAQIFLHQKADDTIVLGSEAAQAVLEAYDGSIASKIVVANPAHLPSGWTLLVPGTHNLLNAACALEAARALGIPDEITREALAAFKGVPGRLELVKEVRGIKVYNDTTSTTPEATIAALHALPGENVYLIMGGADKGLDMKELASLAPAYAKKILLLAGTGTKRLQSEYPDSLGAAPVFENLPDAFSAAVSEAKAGDIILLSPAFASFGMFKNEFDRGDAFMRLVENFA